MALAVTFGTSRVAGLRHSIAEASAIALIVLVAATGACCLLPTSSDVGDVPPKQ
jgi:hypothetical protein